MPIREIRGYFTYLCAEFKSKDMNIRGWEIILIVLVILLMFGGKKIPELMKGLGRGMKEFKDASKGVDTPEPTDKK